VGIAEYVFHRRGRPLKDIDWAWRSARREAGLPEKLFHNFCRTAAWDLVDAGMDYRSAMSVTGHKTQAVFGRGSTRTKHESEMRKPSRDTRPDRNVGPPPGNGKS